MKVIDIYPEIWERYKPPDMSKRDFLIQLRKEATLSLREPTDSGVFMIKTIPKDCYPFGILGPKMDKDDIENLIKACTDELDEIDGFEGTGEWNMDKDD